MTKEELVVLEAMIDKHGLRNVAQALSDIALDKSQHIAENWQDIKLASEWHKAANRLYKLARKVAL